MTELETFFLNPERLATDHLVEQAEYMKVRMAFDKAVASIDGFVMVLNSHRQLIWANDALADYLNCNDIEGLGKRPGELLGCQHSQEMQGGCGTSWSCQYCGAALALKEILDGGEEVIKECSVLQKDTNKSFDFRVKIHNFEFKGASYMFCVFFDVSDVKRREELEGAFLHDIANLVGSVDCLSMLLHSDVPQESSDIFQLLRKTTDSLVSAVEDHRFLILAERGELDEVTKDVSVVQLVQDIVELYRVRVEEEKKSIRFEITVDEDCTLYLIPSLLKRAVENFLKNALEATHEKDEIEITLSENVRDYVVTVCNKADLDDEIIAKLFSRTFSTKGKGRGVGLYSVKLFVENYLKGNCGFDYEHGTICFYLSIPKNSTI